MKEAIVKKHSRWKELAVTVACLSAAALIYGQQWSGEIGAGYVWQNSSGNEDAFVTQYGQGEGFMLDDFAFAYGSDKKKEVFAVKGWGFGSAEPARHADLVLDPGGGWKITMDYDRQAAFFNLNREDFETESSSWTTERWKGRVVWDGWSAARVSMDLKYTKKGGYLYRGLFGADDVYPLRENFDQNMKEVSFKIQTKSLPVFISFEQAFTRYARQNRWEPAGQETIFGTSPTSLTGYSAPRKDETSVPASRLIINYGNDRLDLGGSFLYTSANLDSKGGRTFFFDTQDLTLNRTIWVDAFTGSAKQDTRAANLDAMFKLGSGWFVRAAGDYNKATADSNIFGANIVSSNIGGAGWQKVVEPLDDSGFFDVKDTLLKIELEKRGDGWSSWAGYQGVSRNISWKREVDGDVLGADRSGDGWYIGGSWSRTPLLHVNAEYTKGTFSKYIFRIDPDMVKRFDMRLTSNLGGGWTLGALARWEKSDNPVSQADAGRRNRAWGANAQWANKDATAGFGLSADILKLRAETSTVLPTGEGAVLPYDTDVFTATANGFFTVGRVHFTADLTRVRDNGSTWPMNTWSGGLNTAIDGPKSTQFVLFGQYRSFSQDLCSADNYNVRRFGVIVRWRF
jgi:hypothetical protein